MKESCDVVVDIWGDFAMFTRPDCKVERATYYCPTPSACRNILNAIYFKPPEFYYEITGIEIMSYYIITPTSLTPVREGCTEVKRWTYAKILYIFTAYIEISS